MIKKNDLGLKSTKTRRATNLERLEGLDNIITKEYSDAELNLQRAKMEHTVMMELHLNETVEMAKE